MSGKNPVLHEVEQAPNKAGAIRAVRRLLLKEGREPDRVEVATVLAGTRWTTGDLDKDKNYIASVLSQARARDGRAAFEPGRRARVTASAGPAAAVLKRIKELVQAQANKERRRTLGAPLRRWGAKTDAIRAVISEHPEWQAKQIHEEVNRRGVRVSRQMVYHVMETWKGSERSSLAALADAVQRVDAIAQEVGGFKRLKRCLASWKNLVS